MAKEPIENVQPVYLSARISGSRDAKLARVLAELRGRGARISKVDLINHWIDQLPDPKDTKALDLLATKLAKQ